MIKPHNHGPALAAQIRNAKHAGSVDSFDIWWLGQSGFLIQWNKKCLLFDPYLSDSLTKKYASTNKPHERISELVIEPHLLDCIDVVTSSHNHTDHLDGETLVPLFQVNPHIQFVIPEANRNFVVDRLKCDIDFPIGLTDGEEKEIGDFTFYGVPAAHNEIERDAEGRCKFMGFVVRFGKFTVYHSGDTLWYKDMVKILKPFNIDVAFLPINGNDPARGVAGNLNCREAALLGKEIQARLVIPHHYDLFKFNTADVREFEKEAKVCAQPYCILKLGEHTIFKHPTK
ncbi:MAG: MBL fold metallo-hydrolase [Cyclobacteriaceae bacterium]|nr:MBL fold metallo-hydrolase [Cyclobacteriaceae bacterium]